MIGIHAQRKMRAVLLNGAARDDDGFESLCDCGRYFRIAHEFDTECRCHLLSVSLSLLKELSASLGSLAAIKVTLHVKSAEFFELGVSHHE